MAPELFFSFRGKTLLHLCMQLYMVINIYIDIKFIYTAELVFCLVLFCVIVCMYMHTMHKIVAKQQK